MDWLVIQGGAPLHGEIQVSGAKNAALPLMVAALLTKDVLHLSNVPHLVDITTMVQLLAALGVDVEFNAKTDGADHAGRCIALNGGAVNSQFAPYDIVRKMRASILVLGPLVARYGEVKVSLPGGCAIGTRPVDIHLSALEMMGATITLTEGYVEARAPGGLTGAEIRFPFPSVGATENILMAATLASGTTIIDNAAREPEIVDLAKCLIAMGAQIDGLDTGRLTVHGQPRLHGARHAVMSDRIEAGSFAMAAAITGGELELLGAVEADLGTMIQALDTAGVRIDKTNRGLKVSRKNGPLHGIDVVTQPHPGFPTDLQAQMMALLTTADGASTINETIFENRFMHVPELARMGADIKLQGNTATVRGVEQLKGAPVMATDLRASISLVMAALAADGESAINRVYHLDRGYERIEEKLGRVGANIRRVKE